MKELSFISLISLSLLKCATLQAEVIFDGTLGPSLRLEAPDYQIGAQLGQQYGGNLFHSFKEFNLNFNESATFLGPDSVHNIISRVTGGHPSSIDGVLRSTIPDADFYLINPAGLMFGPNAALDIQGSFHASTADTLRLQEGGEFNARYPTKSVLTVAPPSAFGFLTDSPQAVSINDSQLSVPEESTLSLVGGNIQMDGKEIAAPYGRINLASLTAPSDVTLSSEDLVLTNQAGNITLKNANLHSTEGNIFLRAGQLVLNNTTVQIEAIDAVAGEEINQGNAGVIEIKADSLNLTEGTLISATTWGSTQGGDINLQATDSITLAGVDSQGYGSLISSDTLGTQENAGDGGMITVQAGQLHLTDGAGISTTTQGAGLGGQINIKVAEQVSLSGEDNQGNVSGIYAFALGPGSGGSIELTANQLILSEGTAVRADNEGTGQGGDIKIQVGDLVKLDQLNHAGYGSLITADTRGQMEQAGNGGIIQLTAEQLQLTDGAQIATSTIGTGQGGQIELEVANQVTLSGEDRDGFVSGIFTDSQGETDDAGKGGLIALQVGKLTLTEAATINARTYGPGVGGNIDIQAQTLNLTDGSTITARSEAQGEAGHVELNVGNWIQLHDSLIETKAQSADGGNISVTTPNYIYLVNSKITSRVNEDIGSGGNITLNPEFLVLDSSRVFAKAKQGQGGNIKINTTGIYNFSDERIEQIISASSELGVDGEITISTPDKNTHGGLLILPSIFLDASHLLHSSCSDKWDETSTFFLNHLNGTPLSPQDMAPSSLLTSQFAN